MYRNLMRRCVHKHPYVCKVFHYIKSIYSNLKIILMLKIRTGRCPVALTWMERNKQIASYRFSALHMYQIRELNCGNDGIVVLVTCLCVMRDLDIIIWAYARSESILYNYLFNSFHFCVCTILCQFFPLPRIMMYWTISYGANLAPISLETTEYIRILLLEISFVSYSCFEYMCEYILMLLSYVFG